MAYMFDAAANESAQLTEWYCLGMLYSGGTVNLDVILDVPVELGNEYSSQIGYLDWEFKVEEFEVEPDDPDPPQTGENSKTLIYSGIAIGCTLILAGMLVVLYKKRKEEKTDALS